MAKRKMKQAKVPGSGGGVTNYRIQRQPKYSHTGTDSSVIRYKALGNSLATTSGGYAVANRFYVPGLSSNLTSPVIGPAVVNAYSTGLFKPGCKVRWVPSVSFNTSGRVFVGFTDNPEVAVSMYTLANAVVDAGTYNTYANQVKALGDLSTFPVWQETDINWPTKLRRKRFDVNSTISLTSDNLDRSMQTSMWVAIEGTGGVLTLGSFLYEDIVDVEGLTGIST